MNSLLTKIGVLNNDGKLSLTNGIVYLFVFITAFKMLFSGVILDLSFAKWTIQNVDVSSTLPMLFSLLNYAHKRQTLTNAASSAVNNNGGT